MTGSFPILTLITFIPLVGMFMILLINKENRELIKGVAFTFALIDFILSIVLLILFEPTGDMQFVERLSWIPSFGIEYYLGVDGISLFLLILTSLTSLICFGSTYSSDIKKHLKEFMVLSLLLETGMIGLFLALDFFLFYLFWEIMLVPMYFIIGIWGGPRRVYAAVKFFIYTMFGSLLMLVAIIWLYFHFNELNGYFSTDILAYHGLAIPKNVGLFLFMAFALAFAIKVPLFPLHTWLPDAHVEAPTIGSVILAGILLKVGTYGFLRIALPIFPIIASDTVNWIMVLSVIGIIYGAFVATAQDDVKKLVAYSSVSHLGFVMIGMFALTVSSVEGAILQMINHGISTGALFLAVGVLYERRKTRLISDYSGVTKSMPVFALIFMIVTLSSIALPGTNGFVGEFLILVGSWDRYPVYVILATTGVIFGAVYMLWMFQRVMFQKPTKENENLKDLSIVEIGYFAPLLFLIFYIGIYPKPILDRIEPSVAKLVNQIDEVQRSGFNSTLDMIDDQVIRKSRVDENSNQDQYDDQIESESDLNDTDQDQNDK